MEGRGVGPEPHWKNLNPLNSHHEITTHPLLPIGKQNYPYPPTPPPQHQPNTNSHYFFWYSCSIVITVKLAIDMHITIFLYQTAVTNILKKEELY